MSDLRELMIESDHRQNKAEELERKARLERSEIPALGRTPGPPACGCRGIAHTCGTIC